MFKLKQLVRIKATGEPAIFLGAEKDVNSEYVNWIFVKGDLECVQLDELQPYVVSDLTLPSKQRIDFGPLALDTMYGCLNFKELDIYRSAFVKLLDKTKIKHK